jgi:hypothetical protein
LREIDFVVIASEVEAFVVPLNPPERYESKPGLFGGVNVLILGLDECEDAVFEERPFPRFSNSRQVLQRFWGKIVYFCRYLLRRPAVAYS